MQRRTHPMARGDLLAMLRCNMPTRPLMDLSTTGWHTSSSSTQCSVTNQTLTWWCGANHLPQRRLVGVLPGSLSRMCSCLGASDAAGILPMTCFILNQHAHDCHAVLPTTTPTACRSLGDVKLGILSGSGMHPLPQVT
jgi:hypothetical protein